MLVLGWGPAVAALPRDLRELLDEFRVPYEHIGLYISPVEHAKNASSLNPRKPLNPASVIKLLPSLAALEMLSPSYQWATDVYTTGNSTNGVLNGNLYIEGGGDPYLTVESVWALLKSVRARGIEHIAGDIVVDDGVFALAGFDRAAFDGKPYRVYNGPPNGLMMNFWAVRFTITALSKEVHIDAFPDSSNLKIVNRVKHSNAACARSKRHIGYQVKQTADLVTITFDGILSNRCRPVVMTRAIIPAEHYPAFVLPALWRDAGGSLGGTVKKGPVPDNVRKIYTHPSRTLGEVVRATHKFSNNMMARHILLTLGLLHKTHDIELKDGIRALHDWLRIKHIDVPGLNVVNGSGLSRDTRISARGMANVLRAGYRSRYAPEFLASFPIAGEDRALESREFGEEETAMVRIKTGLIDHVRAMAGYIVSRTGETYIAVLIVNHGGVHRGLGTRLQNAVIRYILEL
ncbi:MAG: D-alanyl-D-alanine carboxypeptidase DacB [Gammaproteobacteria bacterium]|nr:D-alanyl-D-alanine carboxypeptidase DacB [Gammaproteobacteria bacterium]